LIGKGEMNDTIMWIRDGVFTNRPIREDGSDYQDKTLLDKYGMVRIVSSLQGTEIRWNMARPNWASLMVAAAVLPACAAPFKLRFFNAGWFTESQADVSMASERIETLIQKSDVRLSDRAYTMVALPDYAAVPEALRQALQSGHAPDNTSVVCSVETERETSTVEHVGKDSLIARIWGVSPNSYPCLNGHSYDRAVTPEYFKVVNSGKPHYDHVLASMVRPNGELHWLGYQRVILPELSAGRKRVRVISELAPVNIQLL
jgi:hypothetical protein